MSNTFFNEGLLHDRLRAASHTMFWLGLAMVALGVAAIVWPAFSTLVATLFVGWMLLTFGILALFGSFSIHGTGPFFGALLLSLLSIAAGVFLLFNPLAGEIVITLVLAVILMVQGAFEMLFAFDLRPHRSWVYMLLSASASIVLALLIAAEWPKISLVVLGILLGANFISSGLAYIFAGRVLKPLT